MQRNSSSIRQDLDQDMSSQTMVIIQMEKSIPEAIQEIDLRGMDEGKIIRVILRPKKVEFLFEPKICVKKVLQ